MEDKKNFTACNGVLAVFYVVLITYSLEEIFIGIEFKFLRDLFYFPHTADKLTRNFSTAAKIPLSQLFIDFSFCNFHLNTSSNSSMFSKEATDWQTVPRQIYWEARKMYTFLSIKFNLKISAFFEGRF